MIGFSLVDGCGDCLGCSSPNEVCRFSQCLTLAWRLRRESSWLLQAGVEATPVPPLEFDPEGRETRGRKQSRPGAAWWWSRTRSPARQRRRLAGDAQLGEEDFLARLGPDCKLASHFAFGFPAPLVSAKRLPIRDVVDLTLEDDNQGGGGEDVGEGGADDVAGGVVGAVSGDVGPQGVAPGGVSTVPRPSPASVESGLWSSRAVASASRQRASAKIQQKSPKGKPGARKRKRPTRAPVDGPRSERALLFPELEVLAAAGRCWVDHQAEIAAAEKQAAKGRTAASSSEGAETEPDSGVETASVTSPGEDREVAPVTAASHTLSLAEKGAAAGGAGDPGPASQGKVPAAVAAPMVVPAETTEASASNRRLEESSGLPPVGGPPEGGDKATDQVAAASAANAPIQRAAAGGGGNPGPASQGKVPAVVAAPMVVPAETTEASASNHQLEESSKLPPVGGPPEGCDKATDQVAAASAANAPIQRAAAGGGGDPGPASQGKVPAVVAAPMVVPAETTETSASVSQLEESFELPPVGGPSERGDQATGQVAAASGANAPIHIDLLYGADDPSVGGGGILNGSLPAAWSPLVSPSVPLRLRSASEGEVPRMSTPCPDEENGDPLEFSMDIFSDETFSEVSGGLSFLDRGGGGGDDEAAAKLDCVEERYPSRCVGFCRGTDGAGNESMPCQDRLRASEQVS